MLFIVVVVKCQPVVVFVVYCLSYIVLYSLLRFIDVVVLARCDCFFCLFVFYCFIDNVVLLF